MRGVRRALSWRRGPPYRLEDCLPRASGGHAPLMRGAAEEDDAAAECCAALFDDVAAGSCAAAAALARVPQRKASYADASYWRGRYAAELAAAAEEGGGSAPPPPYEW